MLVRQQASNSLTLETNKQTTSYKIYTLGRLQTYNAIQRLIHKKTSPLQCLAMYCNGQVFYESDVTMAVPSSLRQPP